MSGEYAELNAKKLKEEMLQRDTESLYETDRTLYKEMTGDVGAHDQMLGDLEQQLTVLGQIRETGRPEQLLPAQEESKRYQKIGHFDKKARKNAAKEAMALTNKAKNLYNKMQELPKDSVTVSYDLQMTDYMRQAELESLKANGYKEDSAMFMRTRLKYLRHTEFILEKTISEHELDEKQNQTLIDAHKNTQEKISGILNVERVQQIKQDGYRKEVDRQLGQPELSEKDAKVIMKQSVKLLKRDDIDLLSPTLFSPQLVKVNEEQAEKFLKEEQQKEQEEQEEQEEHLDSSLKDLEIMKDPGLNPGAPEVNDNTKLIDDMLAEIQKHKEELGGSPNFGNELPDYADEKKKIFGYTQESFEAFLRDHIDNTKSHLKKGFFKMLAVLGGVKLDKLRETPYETACLHLQSLKGLAQHQEAMTRMFTEANAYKDNKDVCGACGMYFSSVSRLASHIHDNGGPKNTLGQVRSHFDMLRSQFEHAKETGEMASLFGALKGVCFENRTSILQEYCLSHPIEEDTDTGIGEPEDGSLYVKDIAHIPDLDSSVDYMEAASKWIGGLYFSYPEMAFTVADVMPCLKREMAGKKFQNWSNDGSATGEVEVTEEMLEDVNFIEYLTDVLCLVDP